MCDPWVPVLIAFLSGTVAGTIFGAWGRCEVMYKLGFVAGRHAQNYEIEREIRRSAKAATNRDESQQPT